MSEVIHSQKCDYLNAIKLLFQNTFKNEPVTQSKTVLKSALQHFYANVSFISHKLSCVACLLVVSEMIGQLFKTLMANHMYSCHN